jgi:hypothetical protein
MNAKENIRSGLPKRGVGSTPTFWNAVIVSLAATLTLVGCGGGGNGSSTGNSGSGGSQIAAPTDLSYPSIPVLTVGQSLAAVSPQVKGSVSDYSVSPSLPAGLTLNASSGVISGTPTAAEPERGYSITASNAGGSTTAVVEIQVNAVTQQTAAKFAYPNVFYTFIANQPVSLAPLTAGGTATWSVAPALPAGLTLNTATGAITGTPTSTVPPGHYIVTAQNSSGSGSVDVIIDVVSRVLLNLGHTQQVQKIIASGDRVLSQDVGGFYFNDKDPLSACDLWNATTDTFVARFACVGRIAIAGSTVAVSQPWSSGNVVTVLSSVDGHFLTAIPQSEDTFWFQLATDGSYIALADTTTLRVFSPMGALIFSATGDYSGAQAYATPQQLLLANNNKVETITLATQTSTTGPAFTGTFSEWFVDGSHFQTTVGTTVYTYNTMSQQVAVAVVPSTDGLGGYSNFYYAPSALPGPAQLFVYSLTGGSTPVYTSSNSISASFDASGPTAAVIDPLPPGGTGTTGAVTVIDLSGATLAEQTYSYNPAIQLINTFGEPNLSAYGSASASRWWVAANSALVDGPTLASNPVFLAPGRVQSMSGANAVVALLCDSKQLLVVDVGTGAIQNSIPFLQEDPGALQISSDGTVLAASATVAGGTSINVYSLPGATLENTSVIGSGSDLWALSADGTALAESVYNTGAPHNSTVQVTAPSGGAVLGTIPADLTVPGDTLVLSPDASAIAISAPGGNTNIFQNYSLLNTVSGTVLTFLNETEVLAALEVNYQSTSAIYEITNPVPIASPPVPAAPGLVLLSPGAVYLPSEVVYSLPAGTQLWGPGPSPPYYGFPALSSPGAGAGGLVETVSGQQLVASQY